MPTGSRSNGILNGPDGLRQTEVRPAIKRSETGGSPKTLAANICWVGIATQ